MAVAAAAAAAEQVNLPWLKVRVHRVDKTYPVRSGPSPGGFYDAVFGGKQRPLCKVVDMPGCQDAVALTSWRFQLESDLYDVRTGRKQPVRATATVRLLLPLWEDEAGAAPAERQRVHAFIAHTRTHETGHAAACFSVLAAVGAVAAYMPARVPRSAAAAYNTGFSRLVEEFYVALGHKTDHHFDFTTGHGGLFGAELAETSSDSEEDMDIATAQKLSLRRPEGRGEGGGRRRARWRRVSPERPESPASPPEVDPLVQLGGARGRAARGGGEPTPHPTFDLV